MCLTTLPSNSLATLQAQFLTILPRIETHARIYFRHVRCANHKADLVAETVALAWKWFKHLAEDQGKDARQFPSTLASFAAKAVRSGRRLCGQLKAKDAMSEAAQQRHGFAVSKLPDFSTLSNNPLQDALADNTLTPPPEAAAFRIDFPRWRASHAPRNRRLMDGMMLGHRTMALAQRFRLSPARVSQLRQLFHQDWEHFTAAPETPELAPNRPA